jgi:hypothetical protein
MNRSFINILAIIILVLVVLFGARYFFGVDRQAPTANVFQSSNASAPPAHKPEGLPGQRN